MSCDINVDFVRSSFLSYSISLSLLALSVLFILLKGFNFGIDFVGGAVLEVSASKNCDVVQMRKVLISLECGDVSVYSSGLEHSKNITIKVAKNNKGKLNDVTSVIKKSLLENFPNDNLKYLSSEFVGPQINSYLIKSGIKAIIFALLGVALYVWLRFKLSFAIGILLTLVHNVLITLGVASSINLDFNQSTVAALLIIIGYCVNDSIVIYDRIVFNMKINNKIDSSVINSSINQTLSRTFLTSITTLLANVSLIVFGSHSIFSFSVLVFSGIMIGTYASIMLSGPLLLVLSRCIVGKMR
ncbi:protein translocase subunit SecF [Candidatus Sneabacter namystus]|nr:protein translocase subunit SecF [Candidatus Sneabacter namystus]